MDEPRRSAFKSLNDRTSVMAAAHDPPCGGVHFRFDKTYGDAVGHTGTIATRMRMSMLRRVVYARSAIPNHVQPVGETLGLRHDGWS